MFARCGRSFRLSLSAIRYRDKLQSESYQLRKQGLELIEEKGDLRVIDAATIEAIANPDFPALPRNTSEGEK